MANIRTVAELASDQWGLVTVRQARLLDVTPQSMAKMALAGGLVRIAHGIYRLVGSPSHEHEELRAAWLSLDPARTAGERILDPDVEMVSHRSAARVRGLGDLAADVMEFTVPRRRQSRRHDVRLHRGAVTEVDWNLVDGLPVAMAARTIDDLAAERVDRGHLSGIVRDALSRGQAQPDELVRVLARHTRAYGMGVGGGARLLEVLQDEVPDRSAQELLTAVDPTVVQAVMSSLDPALLRAIVRQMQSRPEDE
ncbi:type IV toxin-antitoxin system AbiEi family antitoxin domain-containing protein [Catenuloplanes sp. NPDC051500]|uniref:type IV toxin-antitoxin system AbiEi family antitoxin domain-containing protein n=1 Tax=Catenuloplanes sp. NPDC051500 TaxID=3363959 RepID=UPI00378FF8EC